MEQAQANYERAHTCYAESLEKLRAIGVNKLYIANDLVGFAELAEVQGMSVRAARLLGAAAAFTESRNGILPLGGELERDVPTLRTQLGEAAFAAAWFEGNAMTSEQAVAYALEGKTQFVETRPARDNPHPSLAGPLSNRELEVLCLLAEGLSNREIAQKLYIAIATVKVHTGNIYGKLGVTNRTQAVTQAQKLNLI